jgi:rare lipoprotein A
MRRSILLSGFALLISGSSVISPALAGSSRAVQTADALASQQPSLLADPAEASQAYEPESSDLAIREVQPIQVQDQQPGNPLVPSQPIASSSKLQVRSVTTGQASWYGPGFYGNRTASGEVLRPGTLTAAHRTLPFGTLVRVTNLGNGRTAVVRINDRGPFHGTRVIDLAHGAASELGVASSGIAKVRLEVLR